MFGSLLVCTLPYLYLHTKKEQFGLYTYQTFAFGLLSTLLVAVFHYCLEIVLRNIRTAKHDDELQEFPLNEKSWSLIPQAGRNGTDTHPSEYTISASTYPSTLTYSQTMEPSKNQEKEHSEHEKNKNSDDREAAPSDSGHMLKDIVNYWEKIVNVGNYRYQSLSAVAEDEEKVAQMQARPEVCLQPPVDDRDKENINNNQDRCETLEAGTCNSNTNANVELDKEAGPCVDPQVSTDYVYMMNKLLWDKKEGVVSQYITSVSSAGRSKKSSQSSLPGENPGDLYKQFARTLVHNIFQEIKSKPPEEYVVQDDLGHLQNDVTVFLKHSDDKVPKPASSHRLGSSIDDQGGRLQAHKSDGTLEWCPLYGEPLNSSKKSAQSVPSSTSSCPEVPRVQGSVSDAKVSLGPVAARLSDSVTAIAFRNSFDSLENAASATLEAQSVDRQKSFSSLSKEIGISPDVNTFSTYPTTAAESCHEYNERNVSMTNLVDFITEERVDRLSQETMKHVASASLRNLLSEERLQKLQCIANDFSNKSLRSFTYELVSNLYKVVRSKLEDMIETESRKLSPERVERTTFDDLLLNADTEVQTTLLPAIVDYVTSLLKQQAQSLADVDIDLMMMAFSGQYIDTIVTNAVLQTHVGLLKAKKSLTEIKKEDTDMASVSDANVNNNKDTNVNNNKDSILQTAMTSLEHTAEVKDVIRQVSDHMFRRYMEIRCCTRRGPEEHQLKIKNVFTGLASTYDTFERVLLEASEYIRLLSEKCDLSLIYRDSTMMSELSGIFLANGLEVHEHVSMVEDLSERLMERSLRHACIVVGEDLVQQFLQREDAEQGEHQLTTKGTEDNTVKSSVVGQRPLTTQWSLGRIERGDSKPTQSVASIPSADLSEMIKGKFRPSVGQRIAFMYFPIMNQCILHAMPLLNIVINDIFKVAYAGV